MALCHNCDDARIEYIGNGNQTDFTFPFEYNERTDVAVAYWNEDLYVWEAQSDDIRSRCHGGEEAHCSQEGVSAAGDLV